MTDVSLRFEPTLTVEVLRACRNCGAPGTGVANCPSCGAVMPSPEVQIVPAIVTSPSIAVGRIMLAIGRVFARLAKETP